MNRNDSRDLRENECRECQPAYQRAHRFSLSGATVAQERRHGL
jgi:hypothetical protein